mgnify:CR=1 FL=1
MEAPAETRKHELEHEDQEQSAPKRARPAEEEPNGGLDDEAPPPQDGPTEAIAPAEQATQREAAIEGAVAESDAAVQTPVTYVEAHLPASTGTEGDAHAQHGVDSAEHGDWNQVEGSSSMGGTAEGAHAPPAPLMAPPPGFNSGDYGGAGGYDAGFGGYGGYGGGGGYGGQICKDFQNGLCHRGGRYALLTICIERP